MKPEPPRVGEEIAVTVLGRTSRFRVVDVVDGKPVWRKVEDRHNESAPDPRGRAEG